MEKKGETIKIKWFLMRFHFGLLIIFNTSIAFCQQPDTSIISLPNPEEFSLPKAEVEQHPYHLNYWFEGGIIGIGMTANVLAINRIQGKAAITDDQILLLSAIPVNRFDRWALELDPSKRIQWDNNGDYLLGGIVLLPGLLLFDREIRHDWLPVLTMFAEVHTIVFGTYNYSWLGPTFQDKFRPIVYYDILPLSERKDGNNRNSFYSGHVASAMLSTFMIVKVYTDYHPEIGAKKFLLYAAATIPPLALSYIRVLALKHFPSDNMVGLGLGAICGIAIPELHKHKNNRAGIGMFTTPEGGSGLSFTWKLP